jgi:ATP-dependent DNA helicase RecG
MSVHPRPATTPDQANLREPLTRLRRIFERERAQGCADRLVIGGLAGLVERMAGELRAATPPVAHAPLARLTALAGPYGTLSPSQRAGRLDELVAALAAVEQALRAPARPTAPVAESTDRPSAGRQASPVPPTVPPTRPRPATSPRSVRALAPSEPLTLLPGVGSFRSQLLGRLNLHTIEDLLYHVPTRYQDFTRTPPISGLVYGQPQTVVGRFTQIDSSPTRRGGMVRVAARLEDETGSIRCTWFWPAAMARSRRLPLGELIVVSGRVGAFNGQLAFEQPDFEAADADLLHVGRLVPVYRSTEGLYQKQIRTLVRAALDATRATLADPLPESLRESAGLLPLTAALEGVHFPDSDEQIADARRRLAVDELLIIQLSMQQRRREWQSGQAPSLRLDGAAGASLRRFIEGLPFVLTRAQRRALEEIQADLAGTRPASRLLQGDVGSGKTVVAAAAMLAATAHGYQAAIMAPTEILAEQHAHNLARLYSHLPPGERPEVALLKGSMTKKQKRETGERIAAGQVRIVAGTHALVQEDVSFQRLGLAIIDEQHRFGVVQRAALRGKGDNPHLLVMTATPIPRSLALTMHGDLDLTIIDELPPGRQTIETRYAAAGQRDRAYAFIRKEVAAGRQAFIICPLVEESEAIEARAATAEHERLQREVFPELRVGLLHGRMRPAEKEEVMRAFRDGELDILVSTAVVEVGIDIPNATVMLIEGADRFGLSQLHQFRGRVGRGAHRSFCLLLSDDAGERAEERLRLLAETSDGFALAEHDLRLRGPGEFFGTRQSGLPPLRVAGLGDIQAIELAQRLAAAVVRTDPTLARSEHAALAARLAAFARSAGEAS